MTIVPSAALASGLMINPVGTHGSRTMMLAELRLLLAARPETACRDDYRAAIIEENVLAKDTLATRRDSFRRLRELYALSPETLLFRALRDLWDADTQAQPLLALLCTCARDPLLRATADVILTAPEGATVTPQRIAQAANDAFPGRYNSMSLANIGRHAASTWQQSGHLVGRLNKVRGRALCRPAAVAYALFLGHLCDRRGNALFATLWCRLLDAPEHVLYEQATIASRQGWIDYHAAGAVHDVGFRYLMRNSSGGEQR